MISLLKFISAVPHAITDFASFPTTRYQGSKKKIVSWIYYNLKDIKFTTVLDAFGGTGSVSYLFKQMGKEVTFNDELKFNYLIGKALVENNLYKLTSDDVNNLTVVTDLKKDFIEKTFKDIYYLDKENIWLDTVVSNIINMNYYQPHVIEYKRALAYYALFQSCLIKRPFNLFHRKNLYLRTNDVKRSFGNKTTWEKTFDECLKKFSNEINSLVIKTKKQSIALNSCVFDLDPSGYDLVYFDPPYFRKDGFNESSNYLGCYHFLEGLAKYEDWSTLINYQTINLRMNTAVSKYSYMQETPIIAFEELIEKYRRSKIIFSYKKGGTPSIETIVKIMKKFKRNVYTKSLHYKYALNHQNGDARNNREVLIIGI